jgi:Tfp pilus assembly protein PilN
LSHNTPNNVWLTSMTVAQTVDADPTADAAAETDTEYMSPGLGTVTFQGKGFTHNDVAAWLGMLAKQKGMAQPYFTSSTKELIGTENSVTFTSQATITEDALSKRYTEKAGS